jgi:signal transduction histidine kinase
MGLRALTERAARLGGRLSVVRDEEDGCTLRVWIPGVGRRE